MQRTITNLEPPTEGNAVTWDGEIPGFGARITSAGVVSFVLEYKIHGRKRRYTIGRHPELTATAAREKALQLRAGIIDGRDPMEMREQDRTEPTISELAAEYLSRYAETHKRESSLRNDRAMISTIITPKLGTLRLKAVGKRDIEALHSSLKATPYRANRVLALLSKMFALAMEWEWRADNPARGVPRFHEDRKERWLTTDELDRFMRALDKYPDQSAANALRLLVLTGARESEVLTAEWSQFDLHRGIWTRDSHHTKQKRTEHTPLSEPALELLRRIHRKNSRGPLFPGAKAGEARATIRRPWVQACKAAGLVEVEEVEGKRIMRDGKPRTLKRYKPTVRIHDIRHSYASHLISAGVSLQVVGRLLGHTQTQTTARYAHVQDEALRSATNMMGSILQSAAKQRR